MYFLKRNSLYTKGFVHGTKHIVAAASTTHRPNASGPAGSVAAQTPLVHAAHAGAFALAVGKEAMHKAPKPKRFKTLDLPRLIRCRLRGELDFFSSLSGR